MTVERSNLLREKLNVTDELTRLHTEIAEHRKRLTDSNQKFYRGERNMSKGEYARICGLIKELESRIQALTMRKDSIDTRLELTK